MEIKTTEVTELMNLLYYENKFNTKYVDMQRHGGLVVRAAGVWSCGQCKLAHCVVNNCLLTTNKQNRGFCVFL